MTKPIRVLVTGANGQVGHELLRALTERPSPASRFARVRVRSAVPSEGGSASTPFGTKGVDAQHRGDVWASTKSHPPRSPFLRKGEANTPFGTKGVDAQHRGDAPLLQSKSHPPQFASLRKADGNSVVPATRSGRLDDGTPCERIDLADPDGLRTALDRIAPDVIINAAAYTAVDKAEDEPELAQRINADAVGVVGVWAARHGARVVHYSTDYVFDGASTRPYRETDATQPLGVYGRSKLAGEIALAESGARYLILRTAWVYAARGKNFLLTMLRLGAERDELRVVDDQVGAPTPAGLIADVTTQVVAQWCNDAAPNQDGVHHLVATGQTSWCGFAREIFARAQRAGLIERVPRITAIRTADYPTRAARPAYSVLDTARLRTTFDVDLPDWRDALGGVVDELAAS